MNEVGGSGGVGGLIERGLVAYHATDFGLSACWMLLYEEKTDLSLKPVCHPGVYFSYSEGGKRGKSLFWPFCTFLTRGGEIPIFLG